MPSSKEERDANVEGKPYDEVSGNTDGNPAEVENSTRKTQQARPSPSNKERILEKTTKEFMKGLKVKDPHILMNFGAMGLLTPRDVVEGLCREAISLALKENKTCDYCEQPTPEDNLTNACDRCQMKIEEGIIYEVNSKIAELEKEKEDLIFLLDKTVGEKDGLGEEIYKLNSHIAELESKLSKVGEIMKRHGGTVGNKWLSDKIKEALKE